MRIFYRANLGSKIIMAFRSQFRGYGYVFEVINNSF